MKMGRQHKGHKGQAVWLANSKGLLCDCEIFAKLRISFLSVHVLTVRTLAGVLDGQVVRHILHDYE